MTITYKINNVAKDLNIPVKQVIEIVAQMGGEPKKTGGSLNEAEMNYLMEAYTQQNAESDLSAFWASQEPEKPAAEQKQPAPKAKAKEEPKRQAAQKRSDKTVLLSAFQQDGFACHFGIILSKYRICKISINPVSRSILTDKKGCIHAGFRRFRNYSHSLLPEVF